MRDISKELELVWDFQNTFQHEQNTSLTIGSYAKRGQRLRLFKEELGELFLANHDNDKVEQLDATIDMLFILFGTVHYHGMSEMFISLMNGETENNDTPIANYPVEITTLLNMSNFEKRYITGTANYREILLWCVELCTSVLSLYEQLESDGIVKTGSFSDAFEEVYYSNMSKLDENGNPIFRESDNKILKGKNYYKPNLEQFIA